MVSAIIPSLDSREHSGGTFQKLGRWVAGDGDKVAESFAQSVEIVYGSDDQFSVRFSDMIVMSRLPACHYITIVFTVFFIDIPSACS
jgi:hypothetical protein